MKVNSLVLLHSFRWNVTVCGVVKELSGNEVNIDTTTGKVEHFSIVKDVCSVLILVEDIGSVSTSQAVMLYMPVIFTKLADVYFSLCTRVNALERRPRPSGQKRYR